MWVSISCHKGFSFSNLLDTFKFVTRKCVFNNSWRVRCYPCKCAGSVQFSHSACPTLCDPIDCSPQGSSVHRIFQAKILDWVAISSSIGLHITLKIKCQVLTVTPTFFTVHFNHSILWAHMPQLHLHQLLLWPTFFPDNSMLPFFSSLWSLLKWHLSRGFFPGS